MILLLRCRYTEILKNFDTVLSTMLLKCNDIKSQMGSRLYYKCVADFSNIINLSQPMLENLSDATAKLHKLTFQKKGTPSNVCLSTIMEIIQEFLNLLRNSVPLDVQSKEDIDTKIILANKYLEMYQQKRKTLNKKVYSEFHSKKKRCVFKNAFLTNYTVESFFRNNLQIYNVTNSNNLLNYKEFFTKFEIFCENLNESDYLALGFYNLQHITC